MELVDGLTERPLVTSDAAAVFEVMAAQELVDIGVVEIEEADIVGDWQRPSFDVSAGTVGVFDGNQLVAYAEVARDRGDAAVVKSPVTGEGTGISMFIAAALAALSVTAAAGDAPGPPPEETELARAQFDAALTKAANARGWES